ncbi:MAG: hypothetical protein N2C14_25420 [Planctomycetales bacterium]
MIDAQRATELYRQGVITPMEYFPVIANATTTENMDEVLDQLPVEVIGCFRWCCEVSTRNQYQFFLLLNGEKFPIDRMRAFVEGFEARFAEE